MMLIYGHISDIALLGFDLVALCFIAVLEHDFGFIMSSVSNQHYMK